MQCWWQISYHNQLERIRVLIISGREGKLIGHNWDLKFLEPHWCSHLLMGLFTKGVLSMKKDISWVTNGRQCLFLGKAMEKWSAYLVRKLGYMNRPISDLWMSVWLPIQLNPNSKQMIWRQLRSRLMKLLIHRKFSMGKLYNQSNHFVITTLSCLEGTLRMDLTSKSPHVLEMWRRFAKVYTSMTFCRHR